MKNMKKLKNKLLFISIFLIVGGIVFFSINYFAKGATYGWTQTAWDTLSSNTRAHTDEQADPGVWDEYSSADANLDFTTPGQVSIASEITDLTHTSSDDFSAGTSSGTLTTGDQVSLDLP